MAKRISNLSHFAQSVVSETCDAGGNARGRSWGCDGEKITPCVVRVQAWERGQKQQSLQTLSTSGLLATYIQNLTAGEIGLLERATGQVHRGHETYEFVAELLRLAPQDQRAITRVLQE